MYVRACVPTVFPRKRSGELVFPENGPFVQRDVFRYHALNLNLQQTSHRPLRSHVPATTRETSTPHIVGKYIDAWNTLSPASKPKRCPNIRKTRVRREAAIMREELLLRIAHRLPVGAHRRQPCLDAVPVPAGRPVARGTPAPLRTCARQNPRPITRLQFCQRARKVGEHIVRAIECGVEGLLQGRVVDDAVHACAGLEPRDGPRAHRGIQRFDSALDMLGGGAGAGEGAARGAGSGAGIVECLDGFAGVCEIGCPFRW